VVKIPPEFLDIKSELTVTPGDVQEAFVKVNPGLTPAAMAVGCDNKRLREIRICMSRELAFHECAEVERHTCRRDKLVMPPVRGGCGGLSARGARNGLPAMFEDPRSGMPFSGGASVS